MYFRFRLHLGVLTEHPSVGTVFVSFPPDPLHFFGASFVSIPTFFSSSHLCFVSCYRDSVSTVVSIYLHAGHLLNLYHILQSRFTVVFPFPFALGSFDGASVSGNRLCIFSPRSSTFLWGIVCVHSYVLFLFASLLRVQLSGPTYRHFRACEIFDRMKDYIDKKVAGNGTV